jgi:hypothetical protein
MNRRGCFGVRVTALALGAAVVLLLSGCVYLRLLQLKHQLADFDRYFRLRTTEGLRLDYLKPVLLASDIRWMGFAPATVRKVGSAEQWHLRWVKALPPRVTEEGHFEIAFDLMFTDGKLSGLSIGEHYFKLLPKELVVAGLQSLGHANVDEKNRSVKSAVAVSLQQSGSSWPTRHSVLQLLGTPTEEHIDDKRITLRYRCPSADPEHRGKEFDLWLTFDRQTELLIKTEGRLPVGNVNFDFDPPVSSAATSGQ